MASMEFVLQYPFAVLNDKGFNLKGRWNEDFFRNNNPIVIELGCGKGEYTVALAQKFPERNFIGIDIKGARMWTGASKVRELSLTNVAFLRTDIELLNHFFATGEVSEIWITFPDPQMSKVRKRLTSSRFLELYRNILTPEGIVNLKTDSPFLYTYTRALAEASSLPIVADTNDLYAHGCPHLNDILAIRTFYEQQWLSRGLTIKYLAFKLPANTSFTEPDIEIPHDTYRSFSRGHI